MSNPNDLASDMTIRQRFVMAAMQGMVSSAEDFGGMASFANAAVKLADAALAEEARTRSKA